MSHHPGVSSLISTWVLAFYMEVPDTGWSCNGAEPHHVIFPGARRAHPALPLCRWKMPDSICSEPWMTHGVGDGVSWVLEWSKGGLKHLGRSLKEKSRRGGGGWGRREEPFLSLQSIGVLLVFHLPPQSFNMEENIIQKGKAKIFFTK